MEKMKDEQIMQYADKFVKQLVADSPAKRKTDCEYKGRTQERFCTATTHTNCKKCKYFSPTTRATVKRLMTFILESEERYKEALIDVKNAEAEIARKDMEIAMLKQGIAELGGEV